MLAAPPQLHATSPSFEDQATTRQVAMIDVAEIDSGRLLDGHRELRIRHGNECYRLRHTRNDKLILTK